MLIKRYILKSLVFAAILCTSDHIFAQDILTGYVNEGLASNLVMQQQHFSLDKAMNALKQASSMRLPSVDLDVTYTQASGGRSIILPVGDMLNPVYNTLNALTQSQAFPNIENESINFLPKNYYDAKVRTTLPLLNTDIEANKQVKKGMVEIQKLQIETYKKELTLQIKEAYFNYLMAYRAVSIYQNALQLAEEGLRVNQKLFDAGKGLPAYVIRAKADIAQAESQIIEAQQKLSNAALYFNMLLNRKSDAVIEIDPQLSESEMLGQSELANNYVENREELKSLQSNVDIQKVVEKNNKQFLVPELSAFMDLGSQAEGMKVNSESMYYMVGLNLKMPIFNGNRNRLKIQQSKIEVAEAQSKIEDAAQKLQLSWMVARNDVVAANANLQKTKAQLEAADTYQRLIQKGYAAGVNTYIETVDARVQYTNAKQAVNINAYKLMTAIAKLERETATLNTK